MIKKIILSTIIGILLWITLSRNPVYSEAESPNMKNGYFYNSFEESKPVVSSKERHKEKSFFHWIWNRKQTRKEWTKEDILKFAKYQEYQKKDYAKGLEIVYITHSSFLIQMKEINIITDPIWSERASPFFFIGPKRHTKPAFAIEELPKIDYILLSHSHYDHVDIKTLRKLQKMFNPKIITGLGVCKILKRNGIKNCIEKDWGGEFEVKNDFKIIFEKAKHWSKRTLFDSNKALWGSFILSSPSYKVYIAGDTGYGKHFKMINEQYGNFDVSLIPIGAYNPDFIMKYSHLNPEEAVMAHIDLKSKQSFGKHIKTFQLSDEGFNEPLEHLEDAKGKYKIKAQTFRVLDFGERFVY
jgi:L-ascorbate metabolism protein UlaG (beta-lactamase superfamily)